MLCLWQIKGRFCLKIRLFLVYYNPQTFRVQWPPAIAMPTNFFCVFCVSSRVVMQAYDGLMGYSGRELNKTSFYY